MITILSIFIVLFLWFKINPVTLSNLFTQIGDFIKFILNTIQ